MLYGSQNYTTAMSHCTHSHQLGKGQPRITGMSVIVHPSRSVYGSQSRYAAMPCNQLLPPVLGSQGSGAAMPMRDRSHQLWEPRKVRRNVKSKSLLPVREGSLIWRSNANVPSPFPIIFTEAKHHSQKCQGSHASKGKGRHRIAEMSSRVHPSQPVHRGHQNNAAMSFLSRLVREGSTKACNQQCQSFTTLPTSLWEGQKRPTAMSRGLHSPTSFGPPLSRRKAAMPSPNLNQRSI